MKRWLIVTLSIVAVLGLAAAGGFWWLTRPTEAKPYEAVVDQDQARSNSVVLSVLAANGIEDALVSVGPEQVVVAFDASAAQGDPMKLEGMMITALGAAAGGAQGAPKAIILAAVGETPALQWEADLTRFQEVLDGTLTEEAYLATVVKTPL